MSTYTEDAEAEGFGEISFLTGPWLWKWAHNFGAGEGHFPFLNVYTIQKKKI